MLSSPNPLSEINPDHIGLLNATLRAPSAHNAQPWQIEPLSDGNSYGIHYDQHAGLPHDVDNKDMYLTMGAFAETMALEAPNHGFEIEVSPELTRDGPDVFIARVALQNLSDSTPIDPLSNSIGKRHTNRNRYTKEPLPFELEDKLLGLGNKLVETERLKGVVETASMESWGDPEFVHDLEMWLRKDSSAPDGLTAASMNINGPVLLALEAVYKKGSLKSKLMQRVFASSEVAMFASAPKAAVLTAPDMTPPALFEAGRRLAQSWTTINAAGYSYQPYSVAVDQRSTIPQVGEIAGADYPVALYRVGKAKKPPRVRSNRKPLSEVVI